MMSTTHESQHIVYEDKSTLLANHNSARIMLASSMQTVLSCRRKLTEIKHTNWVKVLRPIQHISDMLILAYLLA